MIASLAGSFLVASCLGCTAPPDDSEAALLNVGPPQPVQGGMSFQSSSSGFDPTFATTPENEFRLPLRLGTAFSPNNFARPFEASQFKALDLATPQPLRALRGDMWTAELSFSAAGEQTGLGLDMSITPRAQIQNDRAGASVARTGAEFRLGSNLSDRDQRGTSAPAPSWYFFIGADNEALVFNMADRNAMDGLALRDQATVGDKQAGIAWTTSKGAQMSLGVIERKLSFNDITGDHDVRRKDHFAAFTYSIRH
jgi:hypothetical protein